MLKALGDRMPVSILEVAVPSHYVESLVVLHENQEEPAVAQLVEVLRRRILELSRSEAQLIAVP
jgi:lipopolysaccharide biosynthesis regulator YciM